MDKDYLTSSNKRYLTGKCIKVIDGDTLDILSNGNVHRVRLLGIDTPEKGQRMGKEAEVFLKKMISQGEGVGIEVSERGYYNRMLGEAYVIGNTNRNRAININKSMVMAGLAWLGENMDSKEYKEAEKYAQYNKLGIYSLENPIEPNKFRKKRKFKK